MRGLKSVIFLVLFVFLQMTWAAEVTVVLQNGLESYDGCEDICISNDMFQFPYANDPDNEKLSMGICNS